MTLYSAVHACACSAWNWFTISSVFREHFTGHESFSSVHARAFVSFDAVQVCGRVFTSMHLRLVGGRALASLLMVGHVTLDDVSRLFDEFGTRHVGRCVARQVANCCLGNRACVLDRCVRCVWFDRCANAAAGSVDHRWNVMVTARLFARHRCLNSILGAEMVSSATTSILLLNNLVQRKDSARLWFVAAAL